MVAYYGTGRNLSFSPLSFLLSFGTGTNFLMGYVNLLFFWRLFVISFSWAFSCYMTQSFLTNTHSKSFLSLGPIFWEIGNGRGRQFSLLAEISFPWAFQWHNTTILKKDKLLVIFGQGEEIGGGGQNLFGLKTLS